MPSHHRFTPVVIAAIAAFAAAPLGAQTTAATPSPATIPVLQCEKPGDLPGPDPSSAQMSRFQKRVDDYKVCVNDYAKSVGGKANEHAELARAYSNAGNAAIEGYNAYVTELNEKSKKK